MRLNFAPFLCAVVCETTPITRRYYRLHLTYEADQDNPGTLCEDGQWMHLDQVLVNGVLLDHPRLSADRPRILTHGRLIYHGTPNRWYSDHLLSIW